MYHHRIYSMSSTKFSVANGHKKPVEIFEEWVDLLDNKSFEKIDSKIQKGDLNPHASIINGLTPLHIACIEGNQEGVKYLLNLNVNIHVKSKIGRTPLQEAVFYGHKNCITLLSKPKFKSQKKQFDFHL